MLSRRHDSPERGSAMIATIAIGIIAAFVIVAIMVGARSSADGTKASHESATSEQLARDAGAALSAAYSTWASGEHDGFAPSQTTLQRHATKIGGSVIPNTSLPADLQRIDTARVPSSRRFTVRQDLRDGRTGYWQVFSVRPPRWGQTAGGRVVVYVRTWTGAGANMTKPVIHRLELRPSWFADYQMLFDGPFLLLNGATINGRVHSNGFRTSFFDQYEPLVAAGEQIRIDPSVSCASTARITTANGSINAAGACASASSQTPDRRINVLRARDAANQLRALCLGPAANRPTIDMACPASTTPISVRLAGNRVITSTGASLDATATGDLPTSHQGAVLVASGDVHLSGSLSDGARALVVAAAPVGSASYGEQAPPSAIITSGGLTGSSGGATSSFGLIVEGDVVFDEWQACPTTFRGAIVTITGLASINRTWRIPLYTQGGRTCPGLAAIEGSIVGHHPPLMSQPGNNAGYARRSYRYLPSLYDNPPPMFPTSADWEVLGFGTADLDCFRNSGGTYTLDTSQPRC